jgi:outer membrane lipoprotein-sorting protein
MKTPLDDDLKQTYEAFGRDHERLRETLMSSLPTGAGLRGQAGVLSNTGQFIRGTIVKSRITKLAAAAVIAVAAIIGFRAFNGTTAWAKVIKALHNADDIHVVLKITCPDGKVQVEQAWLKNKTMFRQDETDEVTIDDGQSRMRLDFRKNTAQLSDSYSPFEDYMEKGRFEIILLFRGEQTAFKATELADESTRTVRVYQVKYRDMWEGKAWVDAKSNLPLRIFAEVAEKYRQRALSIEIMYDYQPIPLEKFSLTIPAGYTKLPRIETQLFSGRVIDERGRGVANAEVCTSHGNLRGRTDERGNFAIKLRPRGTLGGFPMIVRAFKRDDPTRVAWTLLRNPRHERGNEVYIRLADERQLIDFIPGEPGRMIFKDEDDRSPSEVRDIVLETAPASVITGRITNQEGKPIEGAVVWVDRMDVAVGRNQIDIRDIGSTAQDKETISSLNLEDIRLEGKAFTITDKDGRYALGNIPDVWHTIRLEIKAEGYLSEAKRFFQEQACDFTLARGDATIRGSVIDNHGTPLTGWMVTVQVRPDLDGDGRGDEERDFELEDGIVDLQGKFEISGIPMVPGVVVEIRTDEKPRYWGKTELTRGREFTYYRMISEPIKFEPGKKEYWIEISPHRPDITLEIEVRDSKGDLLEGVPVGICSTGNTERIWFTSKLNGRTNENGICTIEEAPRPEKLRIWICRPSLREMGYWRYDDEVNMEVKNAMTAFGSKYHPTEVMVELEEGKKNYRIPVVLKAIDE